MSTRRKALIALSGAPLLLLADAEPWTKEQLVEPAQLAAAMKAGTAGKIIYVGFPVLYRNRHIAGAVLAGPASKPEGLTALKTSVAGLPKDTPLVMYCGCCPFTKCPNVRPAFQALTALGFSRVRVLSIVENLHTDWVAKGYPVEPVS